MFLKGNDFLKNVFTFQSSVTAQFTMFLFNIIHLHLIIMYFCSNINSNFAYFHVEGYFLFDYMMLWWGEFCKFCLETGKQRKTKFRFWNHVHFFFFWADSESATAAVWWGICIWTAQRLRTFHPYCTLGRAWG